MNATFVLDICIQTVVACVAGENRGGGGGTKRAKGKRREKRGMNIYFSKSSMDRFLLLFFFYDGK